MLPEHTRIGSKLLWLAICNIEDKRARDRAKELGNGRGNRKAEGRLVEGAVTTNWKQALQQLALAYPDRIATPFGRIDWAQLGRLDFEPPDLEAFPCLALAYEAGRAGETAPAWLNAANEVAVAAFLDGAIPWVAIADVLKAVLDRHDGTKATSADVVIDVDQRARAHARQIIDAKIA